jgi:hypothetical protein
MLMAITSTVMIVATNLFSGFTRTCHHCPGEDGGSAFSYHPEGAKCPDYVSYCETGRSLFTSGAVFQCLSLVSARKYLDFVDRFMHSLRIHSAKFCFYCLVQRFMDCLVFFLFFISI